MSTESAGKVAPMGFKGCGPWLDRPDFLECPSCGNRLDLRCVPSDDYFYHECTPTWTSQEIVLNLDTDD